jgi:hypothetical protein
MFQDIKVSDDLNIKFFDYLKLESPSTTVQNPTMTNFLGLDFNIYVLQVIINCNFHENHFLFCSGQFMACYKTYDEYIFHSSTAGKTTSIGNKMIFHYPFFQYTTYFLFSLKHFIINNTMVEN